MRRYDGSDFGALHICRFGRRCHRPEPGRRPAKPSRPFNSPNFKIHRALLLLGVSCQLWQSLCSSKPNTKIAVAKYPDGASN